MIKVVLSAVACLAVLGTLLLGTAIDAAAEEETDTASAGGQPHQRVSSADTLLTAIGAATEGDVITIAPGRYRLTGDGFRVTASGTAERPITVRADRPGTVTLELDTSEGFRISGAHWIFENLDVKGVCASHDRCDHAFHIVAGADHTIIRNNRLREFNAMIKGSSRGRDDPSGVANHVIIERNVFSNGAPRKTEGPVTFIDVVGGDGWIVRANLLMDFSKDLGDRTSYGAFLKGNSTNGLFDGNFVICSKHHIGGARIGLSFGGGGTGRKWLIEPYEHKGGVMRNNIIANCSDAGIYLNKAAETDLHNNTIFRTQGIDVRFPETNAVIRDNVFAGEIKSRDDGVFIDQNNLWMVYSDKFEKYYTAPFDLDFSVLRNAPVIDSGVAGSQLGHDFCGNERGDGLPDRGAIEFHPSGPPCDRPLPAPWTASADGGGSSDLGGRDADAAGGGRLSLHRNDRTAVWDGTPIALAPLEFKLIEMISSRPEDLISVEEILAVIRTENPDADGFDLAVQAVSGLRRKFREADSSFSALQFRPGEGFLWQEEDYSP
jgi:parallel beta-helix repeat protein